MALCEVCNQDVTKYKTIIHLSEVNPAQERDSAFGTNAEICPNCGVIQITGAGLDYMKGLQDGYAALTEQEYQGIDHDAIVDEMVLPYSNMNLIWVESDVIESIDDLSESIDTDYDRLGHFLLMDAADRENHYGKCKCPVMTVASGKLIFEDGRKRLSLLMHLGASRIPVAISDEDLALMDELGITYYTSKI